MKHYLIHLQGHLDQRWETMFEGFRLQHDYNDQGQPVTILSGNVIDQAGLYGLINQLRNLGLELISVQPQENTE
jgi:hypothetical protein